MVLKYEGLTVGRLREGMHVSVPTKWDTSFFGNVEEAAWSEIAEALQRRGIYLSGRDSDHVFHLCGLSSDQFLTHWREV
jgi:hypothetical protein